MVISLLYPNASCKWSRPYGAVSPDSSSLIEFSYTTDSTSEIDFMLSTGGFVNFDDEGALFDSDYAKDICEIYVSHV